MTEFIKPKTVRRRAVHQDDVVAFMRIAHPHLMAPSPTLPTQEGVRLCKQLLNEREELLQAIDARDIIEVADGIADVIYVAIYTAHVYGVPLDEVWTLVADTNLAKVVDGELRRDPDTGKILKPIDWEPPDIRGAICDAIPKIELFCPYCRKQHLDLDGWLRRPHHTHLCQTTPDGDDGCGKLFTILPFAFGVQWPKAGA